MTINVFPANVTVYNTENDDGWSKARVRTNPDESRIQVWVEANQYPHKPVCVLDGLVDKVIQVYNPYAARRDRVAQYRLTDGSFVYIEATAGCGFGSKLRQLPQWSRVLQSPVGTGVS